MTTNQMDLFEPIDQRTVDGIEMGILEDGSTYLSGTGLARLCGVDRKVLSRWNYNPAAIQPGRDTIVRDILRGDGYFEDHLFFRVKVNNTPTNAYPEKVVVAVLEYYAFHARKPTDAARTALARLARGGLRAFVYQSMGYGPDGIPSKWQQYIDRVDRQVAMPGYFNVFAEMANVVADMIRGGLRIGPKVVPDISVGRTWARHWNKMSLADDYGQPRQGLHEYPDYFPQSVSNPQMVWFYPDESLAEFRRWLREIYLPEKLSGYLKRQVKRAQITNDQQAAIEDVLVPKQLTKK